MFKKLVAYYLPFDGDMAFRMPWIWENGKQYAYRNAIASVALVGIFFGASAYQLPTLAVTSIQGLAVIATFFATIFSAAAFDPRFR